MKTPRITPDAQASFITLNLTAAIAHVGRLFKPGVISMPSRLGQRLIVASALAAGTVAAPADTGNLLLNPGAEAGSTTNWVIGGVSNPAVDNGSFDSGINPHSGSFDFYGHNGAWGTLSQTVFLPGNQGLSTADIDAGFLAANVSFWEQGLNQGTPSDEARVIISFLDGNTNLIGTNATPFVDSHNLAWQNYSNQYAIPAGTRLITYTMEFFRNAGSDNDSFIDDNVLTVAAGPTPVLSIACGADQAVVWWPPSVTGWTLQTNNDLATGIWGDYPGPVVNNRLTNAPPAGNVFFRLKQQP